MCQSFVCQKMMFYSDRVPASRCLLSLFTLSFWLCLPFWQRVVRVVEKQMYCIWSSLYPFCFHRYCPVFEKQTNKQNKSQTQLNVIQLPFNLAFPLLIDCLMFPTGYFLFWLTFKWFWMWVQSHWFWIEYLISVVQDVTDSCFPPLHVSVG